MESCGHGRILPAAKPSQGGSAASTSASGHGPARTACTAATVGALAHLRPTRPYHSRSCAVRSGCGCAVAFRDPVQELLARAHTHLVLHAVYLCYRNRSSVLEARLPRGCRWPGSWLVAQQLHDQAELVLIISCRTFRKYWCSNIAHASYSRGPHDDI
jgi:hypothetical protein